MRRRGRLWPAPREGQARAASRPCGARHWLQEARRIIAGMSTAHLVHQKSQVHFSACSSENYVEEKRHGAQPADQPQAHRDRHALEPAPVPGWAGGRAIGDDSDGRTRAGDDRSEARASAIQAARIANGARRTDGRWRVAAAVHDDERCGVQHFSTAGCELAEPEAHDLLCRGVVHGKGGGQTRARHDQGRVRYQGLGGPSGSWISRF